MYTYIWYMYLTLIYTVCERKQQQQQKTGVLKRCDSGVFLPTLYVPVVCWCRDTWLLPWYPPHMLPVFREIERVPCRGKQLTRETVLLCLTPLTGVALVARQTRIPRTSNKRRMANHVAQPLTACVRVTRPQIVAFLPLQKRVEGSPRLTGILRRIFSTEVYRVDYAW